MLILRLVLATVMLAGCVSSIGGPAPASTGMGGSPGAGGIADTGGVPGGGGGSMGTGAGGEPGTGGVSGGGGPGAGGVTGAGGVPGGGGRGGAGGTTSSGGGGAGGTIAVSGPLVPAQGALLGAFVGTGSTVPTVEATLGRKLAIVHNFFGWTNDYSNFVRTTLAGGYIPLVTWETWVNNVGISLDDIINGVHDTMIQARAQSARAVGQPFFLRWGHEMNGNWYPWDGFHNGASAAASAKYIATYRHIHDVFRAAGVTNVVWVFCPNVDSVPNVNSVPSAAWNDWSNYYPGDDYVDWVAFDGYNWGTAVAGSTWRPFTNITGTIYAGLAAKGKPLMIPETASAEVGGDKAAWIAAILPSLRVSFPAVKALVWFHMNKETDWRIDSSPAARDAFVVMARDPYFNP